MLIRVTSDDIANGNRHSCKTCPIALAVQRHTVAKGVRIDPLRGIGIYGSKKVRNGLYIWDILSPSWGWARRFDRGENVKPFSFEFPFKMKERGAM